MNEQESMLNQLRRQRLFGALVVTVLQTKTRRRPDKHRQVSVVGELVKLGAGTIE